MAAVALGTPPFLQFTDNTGKWLAYGKLTTQDWDTRESKIVWEDSAGTIPATNPIILDGYGRTPMLYWETDSPYYLYLTDMNDVLIWDSNEPYYPGGASNTPGLEPTKLNNLFLNSQFRFFPQSAYSPVPSSIPDLANGGWYFAKDGTNSSDTLQFEKYALDDTTIDPPSVYGLRYTAIVAGIGETYKDLRFRIQDVRSLNNQSVTISGNFISNLAGTFLVEIGYIQHFGTGGTPSADYPASLGTISLSNLPNYLSISGIIHNLTGKTLGTNGDDYIDFYIRFPLNVVQDIKMVNLYLKIGDAVNGYPYETYEETLAQITSSEIPTYNQKTDFPNITNLPTFNEYAYDVPMLLPNNGILTPAWYPAVPVGCMVDWLTETPPSGWLLCAGQSLEVKSRFNRLYTALGGNTNYWGKPNDNTMASVGGSNLTITNQLIGVVAVPPTAGTTPFTVTVTVTGTGAVAQVTQITCVDAINMLAGQYWTFNLVGANAYYIWYTINGVGNDPQVAGRVGLRIDILSTDVATDIATKTLAAFNPLLFFNVDLRGLFVRYWDTESGRDPDAVSRTNIPDPTAPFAPKQNQNVTGNHVGSYENFDIQSHRHPPETPGDSFDMRRSSGGDSNFITGTQNASASYTGFFGGNETRPRNVYLAKIIKY